MKLFVYKKDSFVGSWIVTRINAICLFGLFSLAFSNSSTINSPWAISIIIPIVSSVLCSYSTYRVLSSTDFFEWDYTERQKKFRFTIKYILVCETVSSMLVFSVFIAYYAISSLDMGVLGNMIIIAPILLLIFNLCNIISLFYPIFEDDLKIGYKIQKKPENWKDNGREIKNDDEIAEIMQRDFNINVKE